MTPRTRSARGGTNRRLLSLLLVGAGAVVACAERLPRRIEQPEPAPPAEPPVGLDARPVSATCAATAAPPAAANALIGFEKVTSAPLTSPVEITQHGGALYVLEQGGRVLRLGDDGASASVVLDLTSKVHSGGEAGLLGVAFHPDFADNGFVYLYYTAPHPTQPPPAGVVFQSVLARFKSEDGGLTLDPASEERVLTIDQPYSNHDGGTIAFGNDGLLYWGLGDGGSGGDPDKNGQNPDTLLGKMLRVDVDGGAPYAIPPDNPFAAGGGRPEIYALGLRNPYRFRFDAVTGTLWVGDVGQGAREEIDKVTLGGNYGWNVREGKICYGAASCPTAGFIDPVVDHGRSEASAITGGVVYRGAGVPLLTGKYVYGDFAHGTFFAIPIDDPAPTPMRLDEGLERKNPSAFALDADGEIVFLHYGGEVLRVVQGGATPPPPEMPAKLSETGCVLPADPSAPADGLFFYDVNVPAWVDGATAERRLSVPAGAAIEADASGRLTPPPGSVAMKTLSAEGRRLETQLLLRRPDSGWSAYTYVWSDDQRDATLATGKAELTLPSGRVHVVVDRAGCVTCHAGAAPVGLEAAQLDRDDIDYGGGRLGNPLATLEHLGMLSAPVPRDAYAPLPRPEGTATAELRARGYLHANCAFCHAGGDGLLDLGFATPLGGMHACDAPGASPAGGRARLAPGVPGESQIVRAMTTTGAGRMPPLASRAPDADGIQLVSSWIASIPSCP